MTTTDGTVGRYLAWLVSALSVGAGVVHFAVAGGHFDVSWWHGAFFAVVAWFQLSWAAVVLVRPTRRLLAVGAIVNTAVIATWLVSRLWGVPVGPEPWTTEPVSFADGLATGLEVGVVTLAMVVLVRPAVAQRSIRPSLARVGIGLSGVAVAVVSTVALAPSFASAHHGSDGGSDGDAEASDHHAEAPAADGSAASASAPGHTNTVIAADGTSACESSGYGNEGNSGHGERGPVPFEPLDGATRDTFAAQVRQADEVAARYPTVRDAEAAGWRGVTPYVPCIAAHYIRSSALANPFDPAEPEILLFDGTEPDSKLVGLSYLAFTRPEEPPEGFAGGNDPWHIHRQLCLGGGGGVLGDESTASDECEARGGRVVPLDNLWMTHMWNVPGWESRWGLFSSEHPDLGGAIGDING